MLENVKNAFEHRTSARLPRGEFWVGTNIFAELQLKDDVMGHVSFCRDMGMDFVSIPIGQPEKHESSYRTFNPQDIQYAAGKVLFVVAVVSGPFQRIVDEEGLQLVLAGMAGEAVGIRKSIAREAEVVNFLLEACTGYGANAVMIAEDVAFENGALFAPKLFHDLLQPSYSEFVDNIHRRGAFAVFHSCGNITNLMADIVSSKFDGLSCQVECLDILYIKRKYGTEVTLFTGLSCEHLENRPLSRSEEQRFREMVTALGANGGFVLCSSSGLYTSNMVSSIRRLYDVADEAWGRIRRSDFR